MIDRTSPVFPLRPKTLMVGAGVSGALFSALLVAWLLCWAAGLISWAACWLAFIVVCILGYAVALALPGLIVGVGIVFLQESSKKNDNAAGGCGCATIVIAISVLGNTWPWMSKLLETPQATLVGLNLANTGYDDDSLNACAAGAKYVFEQLFMKYHVYFYSWSVLAVTLAVAAWTLMVLGLLRMETTFKKVGLRVRYRCKNCGHTSPLFHCPGCSIWHNDLRPSIYGLFQTTCGSCHAKLPTTDFGGRLKMPQLCGKCSSTADASTGRLSEYHFAVVGAQSSGKSNYLFATVWRFVEGFAKPNGLTINFPDVHQKAEYDGYVARFQLGQPLPKTATKERPMAFTLDVVSRTGTNCRLYFYDAAGEDFEAGDIGGAAHGLSGFDFQGYLDGLIFVIDPLAEENMQRSRAAQAGDNPARFESSFMLARLLPALERFQKVATGRAKIPIPIAVVVTKADGCELGTRLKPADIEGAFGSIARAAEETATNTTVVRQYLQEIGAADAVQLLESSFIAVRYFGVSALGRRADSANRTSFQPRGVVGPLVWLGQASNAITDVSVGARVLVNAVDFGRRCLRGQEGTAVRFSSWGVVAALTTGFCGACWMLGGWWLTLAGAFLVFAGPPLAYRISQRGLQDLSDLWAALQRFRQWFTPALNGQRGTTDRRRAWLTLCLLLAIAATLTFITIHFLRPAQKPTSTASSNHSSGSAQLVAEPRLPGLGRYLALPTLGRVWPRTV